MIRVAATINKSAFRSEMTDQVDDLVAWTKEILDGVFPALVSPLFNYIFCTRIITPDRSPRLRTTSSPITYRGALLSVIHLHQPL